MHGFGFQRVAAAKAIERETISADVRQGTRRDAILYAVGANTNHGDRRKPGDTKTAVETLLKDAEWGKWSDQEIARRCAVSAMTVGRTRAELISNNVIDDGPRLASRGGKTYEVDAANIGKRAEPEPVPAYEPVAA